MRELQTILGEGGLDKISTVTGKAGTEGPWRFVLSHVSEAGDHILDSAEPFNIFRNEAYEGGMVEL